MNAVYFKRTEAYDYDTLSANIADMLSNLNLGNLTNSKVLIKPDFLYAALPEQAVTTHPLLLKAVCTYFLDREANVNVRAHHVGGRFDRFLKRCGYKEVLEGFPLDIEPFRKAVVFDLGEPFGQVGLAKEVIESEIFVNMPKLKANCQTVLSGCIDNVFDCMAPLDRRLCYLAANGDVGLIAELEAKICQMLLPEINIVDAVVGLEGQGPGVAGDPVKLSALVVGANAFYVESALSRFFGLSIEDLPVLEQAARMQFFDASSLEINGEFYPVKNFVLPVCKTAFESAAEEGGDNASHSGPVQRIVTRRGCNLCMECAKVCPVGSISVNERGTRLTLDNDKCIRCFSCVAMCPKRALAVKNPTLGQVARKFFDFRGALGLSGK